MTEAWSGDFEFFNEKYESLSLIRALRIQYFENFLIAFLSLN